MMLQVDRARLRRAVAVMAVSVCVLAGLFGASPSTASPTTAALSTAAPAPPGYGDGSLGTYRPITSYRATLQAVTVGAHQTVSVPVRLAGQGLPAGSDYAVVLNVTAASATALSYLTVFQHGTTRPPTSNLNFSGIAAATAVVPMSADGSVDVYNDAGTAGVLVDVAGYYPVGDTFHSLSPKRLLDTRTGQTTSDGQLAGGGAVAGGTSVTVPVAGRTGIPASGVAGVFATVTAVVPTQETYLSAYPAGATRPNASTLNPRPGQILANLAYIPLGAGGAVALYNNAGASHLILDVVGYVSTAATTFHSFAPKRFLDTRAGYATFDGKAQGQGALGDKAVIRVPVAGRAGIPTSASSVVLNITAIQHNGSQGSFLTLGTTNTGSTPLVSNVNPDRSSLATNLAVAQLDIGGDLVLYNNALSVDVIIDIVGWSDAVVRPGVQLAVRTPSGAYPNASTELTALSADGSTLVAFTDATDVSGGSRGLVLVDRVSGKATLLTASSPMGFDPVSISDNGSVVAFTTDIPPNGGAHTDYARLYLYDRATATWSTVPLPPGGLQMTYPSVSGDGRYVSYTLDVEGQVDTFGYVYDRISTTTVPLLKDAQGGVMSTYESRMSRDGRHVAFMSTSPAVAPGAPADGTLRVYVVDRNTAVVTPVSGISADPGGSREVDAISADGSTVLWRPWGKPGSVVWRGSGAQPTTVATSYWYLVGLSADGRYACFPDTSLDGQLYRVDLTTGARRLVSVTKYGTPVLPNPYTAGDRCHLSGDGRIAIFSSSSREYLPLAPQLTATYQNDLEAP